MPLSAVVAYRMRVNSGAFVYVETFTGEGKPAGDWQALAEWDESSMKDNEIVAWRKPSVFNADKIETEIPHGAHKKTWEPLCLWRPMRRTARKAL